MIQEFTIQAVLLPESYWLSPGGNTKTWINKQISFQNTINSFLKCTGEKTKKIRGWIKSAGLLTVY